MIKIPQIRTDYFPCEGGLDLVTSPLRMKPGLLRGALNFEADFNGGYTSIQGYDLFIGDRAGLETAASMDFKRITITAGQVLFPGYEIRGQSSGATARVLGRIHHDSNGWSIRINLSGIDMIVVDVKGHFSVGEIIEQSYSSLVAFQPTGSVESFLPLPGDTMQEVEQLAENIRDAVRINRNKVYPGMPTGVGGGVDLAESVDVRARRTVLGLFRFTFTSPSEYNPYLCAFRTVGGKLSVSTRYFQTPMSPHWLVYGPSITDIDFDETTDRLDIRFGSLAGAGEYAYVATGRSKLLRFDTQSADFYHIPTEISTGADPDTPHLVEIHKNRLFVAIGKNLMCSAVGDDTDWSTGAAEFYVGETITGLQSMVGDPSTSSLLVLTENRTFLLYGNSDDDFKLVAYNNAIGGSRGSLQDFGHPIFANKDGVYVLQPTQSFGSFRSENIVRQIQPWFAERRGAITASAVLRSKNQYRLYFDDGYALYITFRGGKVIGAMPVRLAHTVSCTRVELDSEGNERLLLGTKEGYVFQSDVGRTFYRNPLYAFLHFAFNHVGGPMLVKSFRQLTLELRNRSGLLGLQATYALSDGSAEINPPLKQTIDGSDWYTRYDSGSLWDTQLRYDDSGVKSFDLDTPGEGTNISLVVEQDSSIVPPVTITGVLMSYFPRRVKR